LVVVTQQDLWEINLNLVNGVMWVPDIHAQMEVQLDFLTMVGGIMDGNLTSFGIRTN
jgi:hypothetical protein